MGSRLSSCSFSWSSPSTHCELHPTSSIQRTGHRSPRPRLLQSMGAHAGPDGQLLIADREDEVVLRRLVLDLDSDGTARRKEEASGVELIEFAALRALREDATRGFVDARKVVLD